jgi:hypothetical protein
VAFTGFEEILIEPAVGVKVMPEITFAILLLELSLIKIERESVVLTKEGSLIESSMTFPAMMLLVYSSQLLNVTELSAYL